MLLLYVKSKNEDQSCRAGCASEVQTCRRPCLVAPPLSAMGEKVWKEVGPDPAPARPSARVGESVVSANITFFSSHALATRISRVSDLGLTCRLDCYTKHKI